MSETPRYRLLDHVADLGVEVRAESLEGLFVEAARVLFDLIGTLPATEPKTEETIVVDGRDPEEILRAWLAELLFLSAARRRVFSQFKILALGSRQLRALAWGETYDPGKHSLEREIKAVTFHGLEVTEDREGWRATVIFDI